MQFDPDLPIHRPRTSSSTLASVQFPSGALLLARNAAFPTSLDMTKPLSTTCPKRVRKAGKSSMKSHQKCGTSDSSPHTPHRVPQPQLLGGLGGRDECLLSRGAGLRRQDWRLEGGVCTSYSRGSRETSASIVDNIGIRALKCMGERGWTYSPRVRAFHPAMKGSLLNNP